MAPIGKHTGKRPGKIHFLCPLCKYPQSTNSIRRVGWQHHLQLLVLTAASVVALWPVFGGKGAALYLFYWGAFEFFFRLRKRQALVCQSCGFDPFLYRQDVGKARAALRQHWQARIEKENLFAGKKLKNYQTSSVKSEPEIDLQAQAEKSSDAPPPTPRLP